MNAWSSSCVKETCFLEDRTFELSTIWKGSLSSRIDPYISPSSLRGLIGSSVTVTRLEGVFTTYGESGYWFNRPP